MTGKSHLGKSNGYSEPSLNQSLGGKLGRVWGGIRQKPSNQSLVAPLGLNPEPNMEVFYLELVPFLLVLKKGKPVGNHRLRGSPTKRHNHVVSWGVKAEVSQQILVKQWGLRGLSIVFRVVYLGF